MGSYVSQQPAQAPVEEQQASTPVAENPSTPVRPARAFRGLSLTDSPNLGTPMSPGTQQRVMVDPRSPNRTRTPVAAQNRRRAASAAEFTDPRSPSHGRSPLKIHSGFNQQENVRERHHKLCNFRFLDSQKSIFQNGPNQRASKKVGRIGITQTRTPAVVDDQEN